MGERDQRRASGVIEVCLAHEGGNRVRAAYNRAKFNDERRALLAAWAEYLAREPARVLPIEAMLLESCNASRYTVPI